MFGTYVHSWNILLQRKFAIHLRAAASAFFSCNPSARKLYDVKWMKIFLFYSHIVYYFCIRRVRYIKTLINSLTLGGSKNAGISYPAGVTLWLRFTHTWRMYTKFLIKLHFIMPKVLFVEFVNFTKSATGNKLKSYWVNNSGLFSGTCSIQNTSDALMYLGGSANRFDASSRLSCLAGV